MIGVGESMHGVLSAADILITKFSLTTHENDPSLALSIKNYGRKISINKKHLMKSKTVYRYKLYGLEDGLFMIARSADWIMGLKGDLVLARRIIKEADKIRFIIDKAIISCYRKGDYPAGLVRLRIRYHCWRIKRLRSLRNQ